MNVCSNGVPYKTLYISTLKVDQKNKVTSITSVELVDCLKSDIALETCQSEQLSQTVYKIIELHDHQMSCMHVITAASVGR